MELRVLICTADRHPIRQAREARGLPQRDVGKLARIHHTKIHFFQHGLQPREDELMLFFWRARRAGGCSAGTTSVSDDRPRFIEDSSAAEACQVATRGVERRGLRHGTSKTAALRRFAALEAWGSFSNSSMLKSWRRAANAAKGTPIPRVYNLRHSFATEMYARTGDPKATAELLMHSDKSQMMDRYTIGCVATRLKLAVGTFNAAVPAGKPGRKRLALPAGSTLRKRKRA